MTLKQFLLLISIATGLLWVSWFWVLFTIDPFITNAIGFVLFYTTLFLALTGSIALGGFFYRKAKLHEHLSFHLVSISFRQSVILSTLITSLLVLQGGGLFAWWNMLLLLLLAVGIESVFLAKQKRGSSEIDFTVTQVNSYIPADPQFTRKDI